MRRDATPEARALRYVAELSEERRKNAAQQFERALPGGRSSTLRAAARAKRELDAATRALTTWCDGGAAPSEASLGTAWEDYSARLTQLTRVA